MGFLAVGLGAAVGAWLRWGLTLWLSEKHAYFPWGTFAANAIGGLLVGIAVAHFSRHPERSPAWRLFIITGFLGGLATLSTRLRTIGGRSFVITFWRGRLNMLMKDLLLKGPMRPV